LNKNKVKTVALIGPEADTTRTGGGGSSAVEPIYTVSILDGLKSRLPNDIKLIYSKGVQIDDSIKLVLMDSKWFYTDKSCSQNGLKATFYNNIELTGNPVLERIDPNIDYKWNGIAPGEGVAKDHFSVSWSGYLKVPQTDNYILGAVNTDGARLWIDDQVKIDSWYEQPLVRNVITVKLEKGKLYKIRFDLCENNDTSEVLLGWQKDKNELLEKAVETAKKADIVFLTVGTSDRIEAEGIDRVDMYLPYNQDELIEKVAAVNKNTVVVLTNGSPILMDERIAKNGFILFRINTDSYLDCWSYGKRQLQ
jgi:beta-glucosidase